MAKEKKKKKKTKTKKTELGDGWIRCEKHGYVCDLTRTLTKYLENGTITAPLPHRRERAYFWHKANGTTQWEPPVLSTHASMAKAPENVGVLLPAARGRDVLGYETTGDGKLDAFDTNQDGLLDLASVHTEQTAEQLREELARLKLSDLRKRATSAGPLTGHDVCSVCYGGV